MKCVLGLVTMVIVVLSLLAREGLPNGANHRSRASSSRAPARLLHPDKSRRIPAQSQDTPERLTTTSLSHRASAIDTDPTVIRGELVAPREKISLPLTESLDRNPGEWIPITVAFHKGVSLEDAIRSIQSAGLIVQEPFFQDGRGISAMADATGVDKVASDSKVYQIWPRRPGICPSNYEAGALSGVPNVHPGGVTDYDLTGLGVTLALWDSSGVPRSTHVQLSGRVTNVNSVRVNGHATAAAGTMVSSGVGVWRAKGMSPRATLLAFQRTGTVFDEWVAYQDQYSVGANPWGYYAGWGVGVYPVAWNWYGPPESIEDPQFGKYGLASRAADEATQNDNLLQIESAGNLRFWGPEPGSPHTHSASSDFSIVHYDTHSLNGDEEGFDSLPDMSTAKNIVVVGAVDGTKSIASFSSRGPTDDGRIKPDLVAKGVGLYSTIDSSDTAYGSWGGTSASCPVVAGICGLLIEKFRLEKTLKGYPTRDPPASMMRATLAHTAEDLGPLGPDAAYGWGLVDARAAACLIDRMFLDESGRVHSAYDSVSEEFPNRSFWFAWVPESGIKPRPIRVTLAWADPPGNANLGGDDDRTSPTVHNLDVSLTSPSGVTTHPWMLDPANPSAPAVRGLNDVDTIERIDVPTEKWPAGFYRVTVSYRGTLVSCQPFSLIVD